MNERIRELAEQATKHHPSTESSGEFSIFDKEKFAQLIVMECLGKISGLVIPEEAILPIGSYEKWNQALGHAALEIEQHFFGDQHSDKSTT